MYMQVLACTAFVIHMYMYVIFPFQFYETIVRYDKFFAAESRYIAGIMVWGSVCTRSCHGMGICMHTLMSWYGVSVYMHTLTCTVCNMTIIEYACVCACELWLLPLCA